MIIRSLKVNCKVTSRFAHYVITSQVVNTADKAKEVGFDVEIPKTAFISDFAMCVPCLTPTPRTVHSPGPGKTTAQSGRTVQTISSFPVGLFWAPIAGSRLGPLTMLSA